jgi:adenosylcobinamide-GDP ribazoletransferase
MNFLRHFLLAVQFFTRIPVTGKLAAWVGYSPAMLRASAAHFPAMGWIVGGASAGVFAALYWALPPQDTSIWVAAILSTAFGVMLTGAFHEDGLADTADGLGGGFTRERALDIMKDSRIGTYGAIALVLAVLAKISLLVLLAQIHPQWVLVALFAAHVSSRYMPLWLIRCLAHVGDTAQSKSKPLADSISRTGLWVGGVWWLLAMGLCALVFPWQALLAGALAAALAALFMGWRLHKRLQGYTGDGLGATQQLSEIAFYLGLCLAASAAPS